MSVGVQQARDREHLLERLQSLRAILPVLAQELASARRQVARLRHENGRLAQRVEELERHRGLTRDTRVTRPIGPGATKLSGR